MKNISCEPVTPASAPQGLNMNSRGSQTHGTRRHQSRPSKGSNIHFIGAEFDPFGVGTYPRSTVGWHPRLFTLGPFGAGSTRWRTKRCGICARDVARAPNFALTLPAACLLIRSKVSANKTWFSLRLVGRNHSVSFLRFNFRRDRQNLFDDRKNLFRHCTNLLDPGPNFFHCRSPLREVQANLFDRRTACFEG